MSISNVIKKTKFQNLDLITSNVDLSGLEVETAGDNDRAFILKSKLTAYLNDSRALYDYILIDCPPSLSLLTVMALVSSNSLLVPLQTEFFALEGLTQLMKTIERIKVSLNPELMIRGILLTMYDKRNKLSSQVEKEARDYANNLLSKLDLDHGLNIKNRAQDRNSLGVARQSQMRNESDNEYYVEPHLWTGIGLARSGCGAAIVGTPDTKF